MRLNRTQKIVLAVAALALVAMCLYVPYSYYVRTDGSYNPITGHTGPASGYTSYGYCWIWEAKTMQVGRWFAQAGTLTAVTFVALVVTARKKTD